MPKGNLKWQTKVQRPRVFCSACGCETQIYYLCDKQPIASDKKLCPACFDVTECGNGAHGEDCPTKVFCGGTQ